MCILCKDTASLEIRQSRHCAYKSAQKSHLDRLQRTPREDQAWILRCQGLTYAQIAETLSLSPKTVHAYLSSARTKLKAREAKA